MFSLARILTSGAKKYEERNWERGILYGRVFAALQRHLWQWFMQQDLDQETGESHLAHALACLSFLVTYEARGGNRSNWDDRSKWIFDYAMTVVEKEDKTVEDDPNEFLPQYPPSPLGRLDTDTIRELPHTNRHYHHTPIFKGD